MASQDLSLQFWCHECQATDLPIVLCGRRRSVDEVSGSGERRRPEAEKIGMGSLQTADETWVYLAPRLIRVAGHCRAAAPQLKPLRQHDPDF